MGRVVIRPDGYHDGTAGGYSVTSGGIHTVLADSNDASYFTSLGSTVNSVVVSLANPTIPAGAVITRVTLSFRASVAAGNTNFAIRAYDTYPGAKYQVPAYNIKVGTSLTTFNYILPKSAAGTAWSVATLTSMQVMLYTGAGLKGHELYVTIDYNERPTVAVTAPAGTITTTVRPTITFAYTDPENDPQERFWAKVFTAAQYTAGGFNPETSNPFWQSGPQLSDTSQIDVPVNLTNNVTFRAYVKVGDRNTGGRYSNWAYSQFTIQIVAPAIPTVAIGAVRVLEGNADINLGNGTAGASVLLERSDDAGATWGPVRGTDTLTFTGTTAKLTDWESPPNTAVRYRASAYTTDSFGNVFASATSSPVSVVVPNSLLRLKDPLNPDRNIVISHRDDSLAASYSIPTGVFQPLGGTKAIVLKGTAGGAKIPLSLQFKTEADYTAWMVLWRSGNTLLLQDDMTPGHQWYVLPDDSLDTQLHVTQARRFQPYRTVDLTVIEVARPD